MAYRDAIGTDGVYRKAWTVGAKASADGQEHVMEFSFTPRKPFKGESDDDYERYLRGADLVERPLAKQRAKVLKKVALTPEQKAENKARAAAATAERAAMKEVLVGAGLEIGRAHV